MGTKSKFNSSLLATIVNLYACGKTDEQVAERIGVSVRTIYNWKGKHPDFLQALKEGTQVADDLVEASLFHRATGYSHIEEKIFISDGQIIRAKTRKHYPPDTTAAIFWLKNRRPESWRDAQPDEDLSSDIKEVVQIEQSFEDFCVKASYPKPYPKQVEMKEFGLDREGARLILGSRGYGKTDYIVCLGIAEKLKKNPNYRVLIVTKSKERNAAMLAEIASAAKANGVTFEKENASSLRVTGLIGKDHSVSAVTIKTVTLRGRHPDLVIMDDPVTEDDTSDATRQLVEKKYNEINKLTPNVLIIGQPAHKFDLYAKLRGQVPTMEIPHGTIPELDHDLEAQRLAQVDESSIQKSYFLKVMDEGASPFDKINYIERFPTGDSAVAFIDPSHKGKDHTAISIIKGYLQGVAIVGFTYKMAWNHCLDEIVPLLHKFNVKRVCFETNGLGDQPVIMLGQLLKNAGIGVVGKDTTKNKHSKIMAAGAYAHLLHLSKESNRSYTEQVVKYEYGAEPDDAPDSLASCLEWIGLIKGRN